MRRFVLVRLLALLAAVGSLTFSWACSSDPSDPEPTCAFLPDSLDFPVTATGDTARQTVRLTSLAWKDQRVRLHVSSPEFSVAGPDTGAELDLDGRRTVEVDVRFHPVSAGPKSAQVVVEGARCEPLVCKAAAAWDACVVEPLRLEFGRVELGEEKTLPFTIHCTGPDSASGRVEAACSEYTIEGDGGAFELAPGESLQVEVTYQPQTGGEATCTIALGEGWCEPVECVGTSGKTWRVRVDGTGDAPTVQAGIDSSGHGDVVLVEPGTYYESIDFGGKGITVKGDAGPAATVLDGSLTEAPLVSFTHNETSEAVLEGLTIRLARNHGILCQNASPVIRNNNIVDNLTLPTRYEWGGGMYVTGGSPLLEGNLFEANESNGNAGCIFLSGVNPILRNNVFRNNRSAYDGGVLVLGWIGGTCLIEGNAFWENVGGDHGGVMEIWNDTGVVVIRNNLFVGNVAKGTDGPEDSGTGGALSLRGAGHITVENNTFAANAAVNWAPCTGGDILLDEVSDCHFLRNVFFGAQGCAVACYTDGPANAEFTNNIFWGADPHLAGSDCPFDLTLSNLVVDPLFCDPESGDYRVAWQSPAVTGGFVIGAFPDPGCDAAAAAYQSPGRSSWTLPRVH